jgi:hypothetical protein
MCQRGCVQSKGGVVLMESAGALLVKGCTIASPTVLRALPSRTLLGVCCTACVVFRMSYAA